MNYKPLMSVDDLNGFLSREFPQLNATGKYYTITDVAPGSATIRLDPDHSHIRPGGTISGPTMFSIADLAAYAVILAHIGPVALAVTTNLNINFLRKPEVGPLEGAATLLKLGKRLAVVDCCIQPVGGGELVGHATATYSIPPR